MEVLHIVCEGSSEVNYIVRLRGYLNEVCEGWAQETLLIPVNAGSGNYGVVESCIRREKRRQRSGTYMTWVDYDLYAKNVKSCMKQYQERKKDIKAFYFSFHNFEDFLAMHFDAARYAQYMKSVMASGHCDCPLCGASHEKLFAPIYMDYTGETYRKGMLSEGFIGKNGLSNLVHNMEHRGIPPVISADSNDFAQWLVDFLKSRIAELKFP